jgi:hypothetical protein
LLAKKGVWGGEPEIHAAAQYFGVTIIVYQDNGSFFRYNGDIRGNIAHIGYSRQYDHYYSVKDNDQVFFDGSNHTTNAVDPEALLSEDQCTKSILDGDSDTTSSSHYTFRSSTEHLTSLELPARITSRRWSRAQTERLRQMQDSGCSWKEIQEAFSERTSISLRKNWYKYKVRIVWRTQCMDL